MLNDVPNSFRGMKVIVSVNATKAGDYVTVPRPWRERLLTRPWRPWQRTRRYRPMLPAYFQLGRDTLLVHPAILPELRKLS